MSEIKRLAQAVQHEVYRQEICYEYLAAGKPKRSANWLFEKLISARIELAKTQAVLNEVQEFETAPLAEVQRRLIFKAIEKCNGHKIRAARLLGIGKTTLYRKLDGYNGHQEQTR